MSEAPQDRYQLSENGLISPYTRANLVGHEPIEAQIRDYIDQGTFKNGWIISGADGIGKATLAARIARGLLEPGQLQQKGTLQIDEEASVFCKLAAMAHPDVFIARREWDEKKGRYETEIPIERVRKLIQFLSHTASGAGARVAIIDSADEMNRNGANALLKILEEPPANTLILLLSKAPGALLATIRSRCKIIKLRPVNQESIAQFLKAECECSKEEAALAARASNGSPGYGLKLIEADGLAALSDAEKFIEMARQGTDFSALAARLSGKNQETSWQIFKNHLLSTLSGSAREQVVGGDNGEAVVLEASILLEGWEALSELAARGEGLNLDRAGLIEAMGYDLSRIFQRRAA